MNVYRDPRTGALKLGRYARTSDRSWGELHWDPELLVWTLIKRNSDGRRVVMRTGRLSSPLTPARGQEILERVAIGPQRGGHGHDRRRSSRR